MPTRQIFNANTQQLEDAELVVDKNNEIVATFSDGSFVKFPAVHKVVSEDADGNTLVEQEPVTEQVLSVLIAKEQAANEGKEIITPEMEQATIEQRQNLLETIGTTEEANAQALEAISTPAPSEPSQSTPIEVTTEEPTTDEQPDAPVAPSI